MTREQEQQDQHKEPCGSVKSLRNWMIGALTLHTGFILASLMIAISTNSSLASIMKEQVQIIEKQKNIEEKADRAVHASAEALTLSGRADANIQWIREGLTEVKMRLSYLNNTGGKPPE